MSWEQKLLETYEHNVGITDDNLSERLPMIYHEYRKADLEIMLSLPGDFLGANFINDVDTDTLIPVSEVSKNRDEEKDTGNPHPLCEKLKYLSSHFDMYGSFNDMGFYDKYKEGLKKWIDFEEEVEVKNILQGVYVYIEKNRVLEDLLKSKVFSEENIKSKQGIHGISVRDLLVRFIISTGTDLIKVWEFDELNQSYLKYYDSLLSPNKKLDIATNSFKSTIGVSAHQGKIYPKGMNRKLITADESAGQLKFSGRFKDGQEVISVGYNSSQKIHNTIKWLIKNQGCYIGNGSYYVYWTPKRTITRGDLFAKSVFNKSSLDEQSLKSFNKILNSIDRFDTLNDNMIIMGICSPSDMGALAIFDYYELDLEDFFKKIKKWFEDCAWYYKKENEYVISTPSLYDIVKLLIGSGKGKEYLEADEKEFNRVLSILQSVLLSNQKLPKWIVDTAKKKASNLYSLDKYANFVLITACALIRKYNIDYNKGVISMTLDKECTNRSYLFGRLLAVCEQVERTANFYKGVSRKTNALRLQGEFVQKPLYTWKILESKLLPYWGKLKGGSREYYKNLITNIITLFEQEDFDKKAALDENYLLGYYLQRADFYKERKQEAEDISNSVENLEEEEN